MTNTTVLISGAGVAGAALGHFLHRDGYDVTVVERAPGLRGSGYAVDFRGAAFDVLDELGILDEIRGHDTAMRGTTLVDVDGAEIGQLPAETFSGGPGGSQTRADEDPAPPHRIRTRLHVRRLHHHAHPA